MNGQLVFQESLLSSLSFERIHHHHLLDCNILKVFFRPSGVYDNHITCKRRCEESTAHTNNGERSERRGTIKGANQSHSCIVVVVDEFRKRGRRWRREEMRIIIRGTSSESRERAEADEGPEERASKEYTW